MTGYTKLFGSIVASTIWREPHTVRIVWITMLAVANKNGIVEASVPGLADLARVNVAETEDAILALESPDKYSRTPDFEGRRIQKVDGGWQILNHAKYRAKMGADERREYLKLKQRERRGKLSTRRQQTSTIVNTGNGSSTLSTHAEAEAEAKKERARERAASLPDWLAYAAGMNPPYPVCEAERAWNHYEANGWRVGKNPAKDWKACLRTCYLRWKSEGMPSNGTKKSINNWG